MPLWKLDKGTPSEVLPAEGLLDQDEEALTPCQRECIARLGTTMQLEQEAYLSKHPEVRALLEVFVGKISRTTKRKGILKEAAEYFTRPVEQLDAEIRSHLGGQRDNYLKKDNPPFHYKDIALEDDLKSIININYPPEPMRIPTPEASTINTASSSFISIVTSDTTLPTPEPIPTPEPTLSEHMYLNYKPISIEYKVAFDLLRDFSKSSLSEPIPTPEPTLSEHMYLNYKPISVEYRVAFDLLREFSKSSLPEPIPTPEPTLSEHMFSLVSNTVDKAIFLHVDEPSLRYDTAYVELAKAVEEAMEIPVIEIKEDIAELYFNAYKMFEQDILEKERIAAEIAWEKRMRKKMKRTVRRLDNFKGYVTPPTPKSEISSHESYKKPPPKPCVCHPQVHYNRYPKDRFGIYLPRETEFSDGNVTVTPAISLESLADNEVEENVDAKSVISKKSAVSTKSAVSKKATFKE